MRIKTKYAVLGSLLLLTGCSDNTDNSDDKPGALTSLMSTHIEAVDKAKGVEKTVQDSFDRREQMMNEQGQ